MRNTIIGIAIAACFGASLAAAGTLSCIVTTTCSGSSVVVLRLSSSSNAHAELPSQSTYAQLVCCSGVTGLSNSCSSVFSVFLNLQSVSNSHAERAGLGNYTNNACLSAGSGSTVTTTMQANNCSGYDTTIVSISSSSNAHVASSSVYANQICGTAAVATVSCNTALAATAFGALTPAAVATASPNVSTTLTCDGALGCTLTVNDFGDGFQPGLATTTAPAYRIPSLTATLSAGTEGYGIRAATTTAGSGAVLNVATVYNKTGNAVGAFSTTSITLASSTAAVTGREVLVTHLAAVAATTQASNYFDTITYSCVGN